MKIKNLLNYWVSDVTMLKIVGVSLLGLALFASVNANAYTYNNWSTCTTINGQSVCTVSTCEVTTKETKVTRPLDVTAIIAKLTRSEQQALSQYYQAQVGCNSYPMETITNYANETVCSEKTDAYCGDGVVNTHKDWFVEECDWSDNSLYTCSAHCTIIMKEQPIYTYQPIYSIPAQTMPVAIPKAWAPANCTYESYLAWNC